MANELLSALETRISSAVDTIDTLRSEVKELRAERQSLEDKLRELLDRMGIMDSSEEIGSSDPAAMADQTMSASEGDNVTSISRSAEDSLESESTLGTTENRFGTYGYGTNRSEY